VGRSGVVVGGVGGWLVIGSVVGAVVVVVVGVVVVGAVVVGCAGVAVVCDVVGSVVGVVVVDCGSAFAVTRSGVPLHWVTSRDSVSIDITPSPEFRAIVIACARGYTNSLPAVSPA
jgi:hypothetical protein